MYETITIDTDARGVATLTLNRPDKRNAMSDGLFAQIDAFFTAVQINTDNQVVRRNRLNLLHRIRATTAGVADLTKLEG